MGDFTDERLAEVEGLAKAALAADADPVSLGCGINYVDLWEDYGNATNPDTVLSMCQRIREQAAEIERLRAERSPEKEKRVACMWCKRRVAHSNSEPCRGCLRTVGAAG